MATSAYIPPSVSITEEVLVNTQPILSRPTSIAIVGETLGYLVYSEIVFLEDINAVTLKQSGIDATTLAVVSALDPTATAYVSGTDFILSDADTFGNRTLKRNVYTTIPAQTDLAFVYVDGGAAVVTGIGQFPGFDATVTTDANGDPVTNGIDRFVTSFSDSSDPTNPISIHDADGVASLVLQSIGKFTGAGTHYSTNHISSSSQTVTRVVASGGIQDKQVCYVTYETDTALYENEAVTFTGTTAQHLAHETENVHNSSIIVTNSPTAAAASLPSVVTYNEGATADYVAATFSDNDLYIDRNLNSAQGVNLIGYASNSIAVKVTYNATPTNYYQPTHFFNQSDVEAKYGAALDSNGNINSPASFGAYMAFLNQATDVWIQPLFHTADATVITGARTRTTPSTYAADWAISLRALRDIEEVNVLVPVFAHTASSGTINNATVTAIQSAVISHLAYMAGQQQFIEAIFGEDSTIAGLAAAETLQAHGRSLGAGAYAPQATLVSPGSFAFANPLSGTQVRIGGQYAAAAVSGMLSARNIQIPLTRKPVAGLTDVVDFRSESDKNVDAQAGLLVIENKGGNVRVRHAITTAVNDPNTRELSVVRAKNFMIESIKDTLDTQLVGQIIADQNAPFTVSSTVQGVLEALMEQGIIVDYNGLQSRALAASPTTIEVRFSYKPAFPLNYINVIFSIDTTTGATDTTQANTTA